jgi:hypothetical protein
MPIKGHTGFGVVHLFGNGTDVLVQVGMKIILNMLQPA